MTYDYILVGGGLQNALLALSLRAIRPTATVVLIEREARLGGNHTWSFYGSDLTASAEHIIKPLITAQWDRYQVRFPNFTQTIDQPYYSITSDRLDQVIGQAFAKPPAGQILLSTEVTNIGPDQVTLADGTQLQGRVIIDARGPTRPPAGKCGYQKFLGWEVELDSPWPQSVPTIMDATVAQQDGFRFLYVLPLTPKRVLLEDTYFSDHARLNQDTLRERLGKYLEAQGLRATRLLREESGVLPMPWSDTTPAQLGPPWVGGYAGGWFHPATGYSFPVALRFALTVAQTPPDRLGKQLQILAKSYRWRKIYAQVLNWMAFRLVRPESRWGLYRRFYKALSIAAISRFYALQFTAWDATRMVLGWPPSGLTLSRLWSSGELVCQQR